MGRWKKLLGPFLTTTWGVFDLLIEQTSSSSFLWFFNSTISLLFSCGSNPSKFGGGFSVPSRLKSETVWEIGLGWGYRPSFNRLIVSSMIRSLKIWWIVGRLDSLVCSIKRTKLRSPSEYIFGRGGGAPCTIFKARNCKLLAWNGGCRAHSS